MIRALVVDDEPLVRERLRTLLAAHADFEVVGERGNGPSALEAMGELNPQVVFLDIQMPGLSGLEVMAELGDAQECPPVVFVTAFSEHAVRAFEAAALDYILKPLSAERLEKTLARLRSGAVKPRSAGDLRSSLAPRFPVKAGEGYVFLELKRTSHFEVEDEVVYALAPVQGKLQRFRTDWTSLGEVEEAFPGAGLLRIQRHLLLRPEAVLGLKPLEGGRAAVRVADGVDLEVSRSITPRLKELLGL